MAEPVSEETGAFSTFVAAGIGPVPLYLLSFDKRGACTSTRTRERVLADAASGKFTDVHVYSHGWNNVFKEALDHYTEFFTEYFALRAQAGAHNAGYRPMVVGIIWPSTAFLTADEMGPALAGGTASPVDAPPVVAALAEVTDALGPAQGQRVAELARAPALDPAASAELTRLLLPVIARGAAADEAAQPIGSLAADDILRNWGSNPASQGAPRGQPGTVPGDAATGTPQSAGFLSFLNPREILRKTTVFMMKDRAGVVGQHGVGNLVRDLLQPGATLRVHLTGHSFGAKVVLAALAAQSGPRKVRSMLLLQPAVNAWCFAEHVGEHGVPGAYRAALDQVELPVYTTFSRSDRALSDFFKLALRRQDEQGELRGAPTDDRFGALGGIGPKGMAGNEYVRQIMLAQPTRYPPPAPGVRMVALDGTDGAIRSHGDVRNPFTEWVMVNLVDERPA